MSQTDGLKFQMIVQPNSWSCLLASVSMVSGIPCDQLVRELGNDGSEIWFPNSPPPNNRKGFQIQEFIEIFYWNHQIVIPEIVGDPGIHSDEHPEGIQIFKDNESRLGRWLHLPGVMVGPTSISGELHACAWDGERAYNPADGHTYLIHELPLTMHYFYPFIRIKS